MVQPSVYKSFLFFLVILFASSSFFAQCTIDPNIDYSPDTWGILPLPGTTLPNAVEGQFFEFNFNFKAPKEVQDVVDAGYMPNCLGYCFMDIDEVAIIDIDGMPPGLDKYCYNNSNCVWDGEEHGCVTVKGTPTTPGIYTVDITMEGRVTVLFGAHTERKELIMTYYITVEPKPCVLSAYTQSSNESFTGSYNGTASVFASSDAEPITYQWSNGSQNNQVLGLTSGTYTVTMNDQRGCVLIDTVVIGADSTVVADPCANFAVNLNTQNTTNTDQNNGSVQAFVLGGSAPYSYNWSNNTNSNSIENLTPGSYSVTVSDQANCTYTASTIVQSNAVNTNCPGFEAQISLINHESDLNEGDGALQVNVQGGNEPYSYAWSNGQTSVQATGLSTGLQSVLVQDAQGCIDADTFVVELIDSSGLICDYNIFFTTTNEQTQGSNDGIASAIGYGGSLPYTYQWSNAATSSEINNLPPGIYRLTVTDAVGCEEVDSIKIFEFGDTTCALNLSTLVIPESILGNNDGSASILANGGSAPYTYQWNTGLTASTAYNLASNNYSVTVTDAALCAQSLILHVPNGPVSNNIETATDLVLYPNPTNALITIDHITEGSTIELFDVQGKIISTQKTNNSSYRLNLSALMIPKGVYILQVKSPSKIWRKKVLFQGIAEP